MTADAVIPAAAVLAWAVDVGAAVALCEPPAGPAGIGAAGVALVAPHVLGAPRSLEIPDPVRAALPSEWRVLRLLLAETHAALGRRGLPEWPSVLDGRSGAALLTVCTWADCVRLALTDDERAAWAGEARAAATRGCARWLAAVTASEALAGPTTPCETVRARHHAAVQLAHTGPSIRAGPD